LARTRKSKAQLGGHQEGVEVAKTFIEEEAGKSSRRSADRKKSFKGRKKKGTGMGGLGVGGVHLQLDLWDKTPGTKFFNNVEMNKKRARIFKQPRKREKKRNELRKGGKSCQNHCGKSDHSAR